MKIKFSNMADFIEELEKDKDRIERGIMRVNTITQASSMSPAIQLVFVTAECIVGDHILSYREYCGDLWGAGFECDEKTKGKERSLRARLNENLARLEINDIRGGQIEEQA